VWGYGGESSSRHRSCDHGLLLKVVGMRIIMTNGSTTSPLGATLITVQLHIRVAKGKAVVMQMEGIDLLLGNDFLKQFGKLHIDYQDSQTLITGSCGKMDKSNMYIKKSYP
jgi:hypothetical protein